MYGINRTESMPPQLLPYNRKTLKWKKLCVDWADSKSFFNYELVRKSIMHKKINYDLLNGKLYMKDLELIVNPDNIHAGFIPDSIQHYPIINSKLNVLRGEESKRVFDYRVIITNPNAISEIEANKKEMIMQKLLELVQDLSTSEEEYLEEVLKLQKYANYEWQDIREIRANYLLKHYVKEYNMPIIFNLGFVDAMAVGEEIYLCDIVGGEPIIERVDPLKIRVFRSGSSNKVEDADMIVLEDYWNLGKIIDTYGELLSTKDIKYLENVANGKIGTKENGEEDPRDGLINLNLIDDIVTSEQIFGDPIMQENLPYDIVGNIKVLRVYWKSRRKIKKVKSYDPETGEEEYNFYPETYITNTDMGEEETVFYINEAWEGTKIGDEIYVNMLPRVILYNRLSNPSRCHFGIVGSFYNLNGSKPFSMVDMMKLYNYLYDVIHDRLNKMISRNWGKIVQLDLAKVPKGWDVEKWIYYAKVNGLAVVDSFKEGNIGAATGKLAGALNNASSGVIDAEFGNSILMMISLLEFIKMEMSEVAGISKQREGLISNRETVGGVERATLLSSHITEWLFFMHDDVKKRAIECFLETAKIAMRGRTTKFMYILPDSSRTLLEIDGDEFAEADYGLVVDNGLGVQELSQKMDMLAQAALLNLALSFSTIMKMYNTGSLVEKLRMIESDELAILQRNAEALQLLMQMLQLQIQALMQQKQIELELKDAQNIRDNETKVLIAQIQAESNAEDGIEESEYSQEAKDKLMESMRLFDARLKLDNDKLELEKTKHKDDVKLKEKALALKPKTTTK